MDAVTSTPVPVNEPIRGYLPGSPERASLEARLKDLAAEQVELTMTIGGRRRMAGGDPLPVVQPHRHAAVLGTTAQATAADVADAVAAAKAAAPGWRELPYDERAAVLLRAADLLAGPWRDTVNAATMLGQSKSVFQAEIDAACELIDFLRFNVHFGRQIQAEQPASAAGTWNRMDYRPLEGFVTAITPFNFTSIAANLPMAPALLGNTVVWKPSPTQSLAAYHTMRLLEAAGLPPGVLNLVTGDGQAVSEVALTDRDLAGVHFTGSTRTFQRMWRTVGENIGSYRSYPRLVGETGGKDFVLAHPSADPAALLTALVRGAFEYQGQKCSAVSRAYLPRSLWDGGLRESLAETTRSLSYGDVTDLSHFGGAVIDARAFGRLSELLERVRNERTVDILVGGAVDGRVGYFVRPTVLLGEDPHHEVFTTELFGPVLSVFVYDDGPRDSGWWDGGPRDGGWWEEVLELVDTATPYALTGAVFGTDRVALELAQRRLRFAAGNLYLNDKPTGAVVGQQPFGGGRASGTNDKSGSPWNLLRWVSPRAIKETFVPPTDHRYPHMG
jgi:1-pyrroline-5-carboxylate dehydrogenase